MKDIWQSLLATEGVLEGIPIEGSLFDLDSFKNGKKERIRTIFPKARRIFSGVGPIDLQANGLLFPEGVYEAEGENIIVLPFSTKKALEDCRISPKYFFFAKRKFPYEFVSLVSKGEVRRLIFNAFRLISLRLRGEYRHISYYPKGFRSAFLFRIDTDFATEREIKETYSLLKRMGIRGTWFINAKEHKSLLSFFSSLKGEDIQLHCFAHKTFPDYNRNYEQISKGKRVLEDAGIEVKGFAAPFGLFNLPLYQALLDLNLSFSSEFGLSYDDLPFYPSFGEREFPILQIPIHPICLSRLLEAKFCEEEIFFYYKNYIDWRYKNSQPVFLYDHPHRIAQFPKLWERIIRYIKEKEGIWFMTMSEFFNWWQERKEVRQSLTEKRIPQESERYEIKTLKDFPEEIVQFPIENPKIERVKFGLRGRLRLKWKVLSWKITKYLKER